MREEESRYVVEDEALSESVFRWEGETPAGQNLGENEASAGASPSPVAATLWVFRQSLVVQRHLAVRCYLFGHEGA